MSDKPNLLLVDDEASNIQVLAETLRKDYTIFFALTGENALQTISEQSIDLVLLDVELPDIDGFEILQRMKQESRTRNIPVIFVTSRNEIEDETRGLKMGAVDYVSKPFRPAVVRARINTHLALKRQRELLEKYALLDGLTEVGNRRQFDESLLQRWHAQIRSHSAIGLVMIDIDHFKNYNDHYGHALGDRCLKRIATGLTSSFSRAEDVVTRYGGEEFAIIANAEEGLSFRNHLQRLFGAISALQIEHAFSDNASFVTVSAGAIRMQPTPDTDPKKLIASTDQLLYQAKNDGRNRCWYYDEIEGARECIQPEPM